MFTGTLAAQQQTFGCRPNAVLSYLKSLTKERECSREVGKNPDRIGRMRSVLVCEE